MRSESPRAVLGLAITELRTPRALSTDRSRVAMRVLVVAREQMAGERTRAVNALNALVRTVDLGIDARRPLSARQLSTIARWRDREEDATIAICRREAVRPAQRAQNLDRDLAANRSDITKLVAAEAPRLLDLTGVGAVVAASVLIGMVPSRPGAFRGGDGVAGRNLPNPRLFGKHH